MNMGVRSCIQLTDVHVETRATKIETLKVADIHVSCRGNTPDDVGAAIGDAPVGARLCRSRRASARVGAELGRRAALAPDIATGVQQARIQVRQICSGRRFHGSWHLRSADGVRYWCRHGRSSRT